MNRRNNWQDLLVLANEDLAKQKFCITITDPEGDGCFQCDIFNNGVLEETYAENYYEDELPDLIMDAWHYVKEEYFEL